MDKNHENGHNPVTKKKVALGVAIASPFAIVLSQVMTDYFDYMLSHCS